jgi:hypothetical protein
MNAPNIGARVKHKEHGELGTIEAYRKDGRPLVRWDYGSLLQCPMESLELLDAK